MHRGSKGEVKVSYSLAEVGGHYRHVCLDPISGLKSDIAKNLPCARLGLLTPSNPCLYSITSYRRRQHSAAHLAAPRLAFIFSELEDDLPEMLSFLHVSDCGHGVCPRKHLIDDRTPASRLHRQPLPGRLRPRWAREATGI
jgi:hypothetical protein